VTLAVFLIGLAALGYVLWLFLAGDALWREVSRAEVPGTNLTVVIYKDEKDLARYWVLADGERSSVGERIFGGYGLVAQLPLLERTSDWVRMMWNSESGLLFIDFDLTTCQIVVDSGGSRDIPRLERCRRTE
jgi:hypothetical protein